MANNGTEGTDSTEPSTSVSPTPREDDEESPSASPEQTEPTDEPDDGKRKKSEADKRRKRSQQSLRDRVEVTADGLAPDPAGFRLASFNVLGDSHTRPGGNKPGFASARSRMGWTVQLVRGNGISVLGLQEYEPSQHGMFSSLAGGTWDVYPGLQLGRKGVRNSIAWNTSVFELVEAHTTTIPYFHGKPAVIPYVLLEHKDTGRLAWFINVHNPASTRGPAQHLRNQATAKEIALMNELQEPQSTNQLGVPTFLMGDFNEKAEAFCMVTQGADAQAANGGTSTPCAPPGGHGIDWIFGSTPGVSFANYVRMDGGLADRASDHPLIFADVTLTGEAPALQ
jgi:hypothetical protein